MTLAGYGLSIPSLAVAGLIVIAVATVAYYLGRHKERKLWKSVVETLRANQRELELTCSAQSRLIEKLQQRIQDSEAGPQRYE